jgi:hypothetical protein
MTDARSPADDAHCEECGARLTQQEMKIVLNRGGPVMCSKHMADVVEKDDDSLGAETEL